MKNVHTYRPSLFKFCINNDQSQINGENGDTSQRYSIRYYTLDGQMLHYTFASLRCEGPILHDENILTRSLLAATLTSANGLGPDKGGS